MGVVVVALVLAFKKDKRKVIGGAIGGFFGFLIPFLLAQLYVWRGGDPTAAGAYSFVGMLTVPLGIGIGVMLAVQKPKHTDLPAKSEFRCLNCGVAIRPKDESCPNCGWTWKQTPSEPPL